MWSLLPLGAARTAACEDVGQTRPRPRCVSKERGRETATPEAGPAGLIIDSSVSVLLCGGSTASTTSGRCGRFSSVTSVRRAARLMDDSGMASGRLSLRSGLVSVLVVLVAQLALSGCGDHSTPAADKCSEHSKPAAAGERVNWDGVQFDVPVGWYPVSVCFLTASTTPPVGYLTSQPPQAQCAPADAAGGSCHPPASQLSDKDVLVVAAQTSTSLARNIRPNAIVAGRPARIVTSPAHAEFPGADQIVRADILLLHHQVLTVTAYLGRSAQVERVVAMLHGARLRV